jgi:hypothetical protein
MQIQILRWRGWVPGQAVPLVAAARGATTVTPSRLPTPQVYHQGRLAREGRVCGCGGLW